MVYYLFYLKKFSVMTQKNAQGLNEIIKIRIKNIKNILFRNIKSNFKLRF